MNYKLLSQEYLNTGGGCMVHIREVYDLDSKRMLYMMSNEEGSSLVTGDYIREDIDYDDVEVIANLEVGVTGCDHWLFSLFCDCQLDYSKEDFRMFKNYRRLPIDMIPADMISDVTQDYLDWLMREKDGCISTNGEHVYVDDDYRGPEAVAAARFIDYMNGEFTNANTMGEAALERFYNMEFTFGFGERMIRIGNNADTFDGLIRLLQEYIDEQ